MPRLLVLTPAELSSDPRGRRAARAGGERGFEVVGVCGRVAGDSARDLDAVRIERVAGDRVTSALRQVGLGGMRRSSPPMRELRGMYRVMRLAGLTFRLVRAARNAGPFDVVHANDFDTLPAAWLVARRDRARLVYDSHELYTSQEPEPPRLFVWIAAALERALARRAAAVVTTGEPFALELQRRFQLGARPHVWLNCPERIEVRAASTPETGRLKAIYQAAMGPGRPLEDLLEAAGHLRNVELTLRVVGADTNELSRQIAARGLGDVVRLAAPVAPGALVEALAEFQLGLIINRPITMTDELVVPNKLFEYMMAGLAPVVPQLPGLGPFVERNAIGASFAPGSPASLAAALEKLAADRAALDAMRLRARQLALDEFHAAAQVEVLDRAWGLRPSEPARDPAADAASA